MKVTHKIKKKNLKPLYFQTFAHAPFLEWTQFN